MMDICHKYANDYNIQFNGTESQYLIFKDLYRTCSAKLCYINIQGILLYNVKSVIHLGHKIDVDSHDSLLTDANSKFWKSYVVVRFWSE